MHMLLAGMSIFYVFVWMIGNRVWEMECSCCVWIGMRTEEEIYCGVVSSLDGEWLWWCSKLQSGDEDEMKMGEEDHQDFNYNSLVPFHFLFPPTGIVLII